MNQFNICLFVKKIKFVTLPLFAQFSIQFVVFSIIELKSSIHILALRVMFR